MAQFTIDIPTDKVQDTLAAFASNYNYSEEIRGPNDELIPNPESKAEFAKRQIRKYIKDNYVQYKLKVLQVDKVTLTETANAESDTITIN